MRRIWVDAVFFVIARLTWYLLQFVNYAKRRYFLGTAADIDKPTGLDEWACLNDEYEALMPPSGPKSVSLRFRPAARKIDDEGWFAEEAGSVRGRVHTRERASCRRMRAFGLTLWMVACPGTCWARYSVCQNSEPKFTLFFFRGMRACRWRAIRASRVS